MKYKLRQILLLVLVIAGIGGGVYGFMQIETNKGLHWLDGTPTSMEEVRNAAQIMVVMYWNSSCQYCGEQVRILNMIQNTFEYYFVETNEVVGYVVGINVSDGDSKVKEYWAIANPKFPTLAGGKAPGNGTPIVEIYINGQLVKTQVGVMTYEQIMGVITK